MTDAAHTKATATAAKEAEVPEMHRHAVDDAAGSTRDRRGLSSSTTAAAAAAPSSASLLSRCFHRFDLLVLANHLYLLISLGYLSLDSLRLVMSTPGTGAQSASAMMGPEMGAGEETAVPTASRLASDESNNAAAISHLHFVLISDTCMLLLAALFVVDAAMFAFVHARSVYAARAERRAMLRKQEMRLQQQQQQLAVHSPTITSLRIESATPAPASSSSSVGSGKYSGALTSPERQTLLLASLSSKLAASPPNANSSVHVELTPFIARERRGSAQVAAELRSSTSASSARYNLLPLLSLFLSSPSGIAELLNILGGLGYLLSSLIPFLFFLVSEPTERALDRAANVVDNLAMGVFVVDSWLYLALWSSRAKGDSNKRRGRRGAAAAAGSDGEQHEEDQSISGTHSQERQGLIQEDASSSSPPMTPSLSPSPASGRRSSRRLLSSSSGSSASSHRSLCDRRSWDLALASNLFNILAGVFYLASTIFGFVIRVRADAALHEIIRAAADAREAAAAAAAADPSVVPGAAAAAAVASGVLFHAPHSSWQQASLFLFFQSASRSSRRDPLLDSSIVDPLLRSSSAYQSWARSVEAGFHSQQCLALVGDFMYFLCALAMEAAYYSEQDRSRARGKEEEEADTAEEEEETEEEFGAASEAEDAEQHSHARRNEAMRIHLDAPSDSDDPHRSSSGSVPAPAPGPVPQFSPLQLQLLTPLSAISRGSGSQGSSQQGSATPASLFLPSSSPPASAASSATPTSIPSATVAASSNAPFLRHPHPSQPQPQYSPSPNASPQPAMPFPINAVLAEAQQRQPRTMMLHGPASTGASTPLVSSSSHLIAVDARDASFAMSPMSPPNATSTPHSNAGSRSNSRA